MSAEISGPCIANAVIKEGEPTAAMHVDYLLLSLHLNVPASELGLLTVATFKPVS